MAAEVEAKAKEIEAMAKEILLSGAPETLTTSVIADVVHDLAPPVIHEIGSVVKLINRVAEKDGAGTALWLLELIAPRIVNRLIPTHTIGYLAKKLPEIPR